MHPAFVAAAFRGGGFSAQKTRYNLPNQMNPESARPNRAARILTDVHFWVPVAVLVAGLLLLRLFP